MARKKATRKQQAGNRAWRRHLYQERQVERHGGMRMDIGIPTAEFASSSIKQINTWFRGGLKGI